MLVLNVGADLEEAWKAVSSSSIFSCESSVRVGIPQESMMPLELVESTSEMDDCSELSLVRRFLLLLVPALLVVDVLGP